MEFVILSRKRTLYSTRRLGEEADTLKVKTRIIDPVRCVISLTDNKPNILVGGKPLDNVDVVLPRVGTYATTFAIAIVRQFRLMGVPTVNSDEAISRTRNKLRCMQYLVQNGINVPDTIMARYPYHFSKLLKFVGGTPVVLKLLTGTQGTGVILSETAGAAQSALEALWSLGQDIMMQRFIRESKGKDLRALVVGGNVVAAMRRTSQREEEFRSNIHRGAVGEPVKLKSDYEEVALKAAKVTGLGLAGVDILESKDGPLVIEVNSSPGFQGLEIATRKNVAKLIVKYAIKCAKNGTR